MQTMPLPFELRAAKASDFSFCWPLYRDAVQPLTEALMAWNEATQRRMVEQAVGGSDASILQTDKVDAGWLQVAETRHVVHLQHLYLLPEMRNRGLGTAFLNWMKERADRKRKDLTLEVMANSPARRLCDRLGFKALTTADNKISMRY